MKKVYIDMSGAESEIVNEEGRIVECSTCFSEMIVWSENEIACPQGCERYEVENLSIKI